MAPSDTSWKFMHWSNLQKCKKVPFLPIFRVRTVKKSKRPSFGQFWSYRTCPYLIWKLFTHIFWGTHRNCHHLWNSGPQATLKWDDPDLCPQKSLVLGITFGRKPWFRQFLPHLPPSLPYMVGKLCISASIWHRAIEIWRILPPVRILMTWWNRNVTLSYIVDNNGIKSS